MASLQMEHHGALQCSAMRHQQRQVPRACAPRVQRCLTRLTAHASSNTTTTVVQEERQLLSPSPGPAELLVLHDRSALTPLAPLGMDLSAYPSLQNKNVLVTGAARGIGFNTARLLAGLGATVYLADVDEGGLQQAAEDIQKQVIGSKVVVTPRLDLGCTDAVHYWCDAWLAGQMAPTQPSRRARTPHISEDGGSSSGGEEAPATAGPPPLHVLVNNAGANFMGVEPWYTKHGVAGLPQVNFVGPYTLTRRLVPSLRAAGDGARVVTVASVMHRFSEIPHDVEQFFTCWWKGGAYRNCKHANVVLKRLLHQAAQRAVEERGAPSLVSVAVDPGAVYSNIWANSRVFGRPPGSTVIKALFSTPQDACATSVHAAAAADVRGGQYFARGLFARSAIVKSLWEPAAGVVSCLDWPLRKASAGRVAATIKAVDIAPKALAAEADGRGVALWDKAAKLAGLPPWSAGLDCHV